MANAILTREEAQAIVEQFQELENGKNTHVASITIRLQSGTTGTFTRNVDKVWQVTLAGNPDSGDYFGR